MHDALVQRIAELTADVEIRPGNNSTEDADRFVDIFNRHYSRSVDREYYFWQFFGRGANSGRCIFAEKDGQVVATYGFRIVGLRRGTKLVRGALTVDEIVTEGYRRLGLVYRLEKALEEQARCMDCDLMYALPNHEGARVKLRELGWELAGQSSQYSGVVTGEFASSSNLTFEEVPKFGAEASNLAGRFAEMNSDIVMVERSSDYLDWRYVRNPWYQYRFFTVHRGREPIGHLVTKLFVDPDTKQTSGDLVDLLCTDPDALRDTILFGLSKTTESGAERNFIWCPDQQSATAAQQLGLQPQPGKARQLCVKSLVETPLVGSHSTAANWFLTMGDSEIY